MGFGLTPYWVEKINAIRPTGAEATIIVVSDIEKSILLRFHIKIIASIGWRTTLKITIKYDILICVFSNLWESIMPAAKRAQGAADSETKSKDLEIVIGNLISKKMIIKPITNANNGMFENCLRKMVFKLNFWNFIQSKIIKLITRNITSNPIIAIIGFIKLASYSFRAIG